MIERTYLVTVRDLTTDDRCPSTVGLGEIIGEELGSDIGLVDVVVVDAPDAHYGPRCSCRVTHADDCDLRAHE